MRRLLLRVRVRHFEAHEEFCFGADGHAEGVLWGGTSGIAGGGNRHPTSCQKRLTPPGTVGDTWAALAAMAVAAATTITRVRSSPARKGPSRKNTKTARPSSTAHSQSSKVSMDLCWWGM